MPVVLKASQEQTFLDADFFSEEEAKKLFDATARRYLKISGAEFLRHWDAGDYLGRDGEENNVMRVAVLVPMVRSVSVRQNAL